MASENSDGPAAPRASGRVRKRPRTLYDTPGDSSSKRRRSDGIDEDEDMVNYNESSSDGDEGEPDEEEVRAHTKAKRQSAQKKSRANGTTTLPIRQTGKKKASKKTLSGIDASAAGGMFAELFAQNVDPQQIVSEWLQRFEQRESTALAELINFVLRAAGCTSSVSEEQVENVDAVTDAIGELQDEFQASNPTDYPLMQSRGKTATTVKHGVETLLDTLIQSTAQNGMLYDRPELMENIHTWFATMSTAANRPFRHTATVVSLICTTSLCKIARSLSDDAAKSQRQAETESKKASKNKARVSEIQKKSKEANDRVEAVKEIIADWYNTVFIHRYKDVDAAIRKECTAALGDWVCVLPSTYLGSSHLRYLGWLLSDTSASVRLEAVKQANRFYKELDNVGGLSSFVGKFRARLVEIATHDAEAAVRVVTIDLLCMLREHALLEVDDIDAVGRLIFETDDKVRKAASRFLAAGIIDVYNAEINDLGGSEALEEVLTSRDDNYKAPRLEWLKLKCIAQALAVYHNNETLPHSIERPRLGGELTIVAAGTESRYALAAHDLIDKVKETRNPQIIAGYLLADTPAKNKRKTNDLAARFRAECVLAEREELAMLDVLHVSIRQEISAMTDKLRGSSSKKLQVEQQEELEEIVRHTLTTLPLLLERFANSSEAVVAILRTFQALRTPAVQDLGIEAAAYQPLLEQAKQQFLTHTTDDLLSLAAGVIAQANSQSELEEAAHDALSDLWETTVVGLVNGLDLAKIKQRGAASESDLRDTLNNLRRLAQLSLIADPITALEDEAVLRQAQNSDDHKAAIDCIISLLGRAQHTRKVSDIVGKLEDDIAQRASEVALLYFQWRFVAIKNKVSGPTGISLPFEELEALAARRDLYADTVSLILQQRKAKDEFCVVFAGQLIDLHTSSSTLVDVQRKADVSDDYTVFIMEIEGAKQKSVLRAFAGAEAVLASLTNKHLDNESSNPQDEDAVDFDEDPLSDDEDDDVDTQTQVSQVKAEEKLKAALLAEIRLCQLTSKIVMAVLANLLDKKTTRARIERNKQKLGNNFKEVCKYFELGEKSGLKLKTRIAKKAATASAHSTNARGRKANAIDAESEEDDQIEDIEDGEQVQEREPVDDVDDEMDL